MGKFFAAMIIAFMIGWLTPMCAHLPNDLAVAPAPTPAAAPAEPDLPPEPVAAPTPAPAPAPAPAAVLLSPVTITTYRSRSMFPVEGDNYIVSVLRRNHAEAPAVGVRLAVAARVKGEVIERAESGPGQTLAPGSTSYFGLPVTTEVFDHILDGPEDVGNRLEWTLTYRLETDAPDAKRCFSHNALPRRREPSGLQWLPLGQSRKCE
ncbi:MAG: hypothetical protein Q8T11_10545 [Elusimicrobiota bacterium]|nr:hypothetical protein [Elusimicrobiota bacterium]